MGQGLVQDDADDRLAFGILRIPLGSYANRAGGWAYSGRPTTRLAKTAAPRIVTGAGAFNGDDVEADSVMAAAAIARDGIDPPPALICAAEAAGYSPAAFEVAVRLLTSSPAAYFDLMAEVAGILDAIGGPVRIEVATLNSRETAPVDADPAREGALAAIEGRTLADNPYEDAKNRGAWMAGYRRARRDGLAGPLSVSCAAK